MQMIQRLIRNKAAVFDNPHHKHNLFLLNESEWKNNGNSFFFISGHVVNSKPVFLYVSTQHKQARLPQQLAEYGLSATKDFILA